MRSEIAKNFLTYALIALLISLLLNPVLEARISAPLLVILFSLIGGLFGSGRLNFLFLFTAWAFALSYAAISLTPVVRAAAPFFVVNDPLPSTVDAVVVLSAEWPLRDRIKSQGLERLIHGMRLIQEGLAPTLVLTDLPWYRGNPTKDRTLLLGEISKNTVTVGPSENTFEEAQEVRKLALQRGWKQIVVVTSPLHSRRAKAIFSEQLPEFTIISSPAEAREFDLDILFTCDEKLRAARLMIYEIAAWGKNLILGRL